METFSLFQLNEYVKRVIALNFQDAIWIKAEISQIKMSRGAYYLDLMEKDQITDEIKAKASAIIWYKTYSFLKKKFNTVIDSILDTGNEIRIKIKVQFDERYGFSLIIEDLDPAYTIGQAEILRQEILNRLKKENLIASNSSLNLPEVIQRIAVISSENAAGYLDFINHLKENPFGYFFKLDLYHTAVQGKAAESEIVNALKLIGAHSSKYDVVVIIRGGGSKLDLSAFDNYNLASAIAKCAKPVLTGIGHEIDQSIADIVSHTALKTPTAVADFLLEHNAKFENRLSESALRLKSAYTNIMNAENKKLELYLLQLKTQSNQIIKQARSKNDELLKQLITLSKYKLEEQTKYLSALKIQLQLSSPENVLKRGFAIVEKDGKPLRTIEDLFLDDLVTTRIQDGQFISVIRKTQNI